MTGLTYKGLGNKEYKAGNLIGTGGEGSVYESKKDEREVLKIYHESPNLEKVGKLKRMVAMKDEGLLSFSAWPIDVLYDAKNGSAVGFVMYKLTDTQPIHRLFSPFDRKQYFAECGYNFLIHVAVNVAMAFGKYHQHGIMIGDVNEGNIQVQKDGRVIFIDCDSFQVKNNDHTFFCEVGIPRYTAPELLEKGSFHNLERNPNTEIFSMAVLIFQLIFLGRHPFVGVNLTAEDIDEEKAIKNFIFPYSVTTVHKLSAPPNTLAFKSLSPGLIQLFGDTFENRDTRFNRPPVELWINELSAYKNSLLICTKSKLHFHSPYDDICPWCDFIKTQGIYYFADDVLKSIPLAARDINYLRDIEFFVNSKTLFIDFNAEYFDYRQIRIKHQPYPAQFFFNKYASRGIIVAIILIFGGLTILNELFAIVGITTLILFYMNDPFKSFLNNKKKALKLNYDTLKNRFEVHVREYNGMNELKQYNKLKNETEHLIQKYKGLPAKFTADKNFVESSAYEKELNIFLRDFKIADHNIQSIGPARQHKLYDNNIRTAADVQTKNLNITGIGQSVISTLIDWRLGLSKRFVYVPDQLTIFRKITELNKQYADTKQQYAGLIVTNITDAKKLEPAISQKRMQLKNSIQKLSRELKAAEIDYNEFIKQF